MEYNNIFFSFFGGKIAPFFSVFAIAGLARYIFDRRHIITAVLEVTMLSFFGGYANIFLEYMHSVFTNIHND